MKSRWETSASVAKVFATLAVLAILALAIWACWWALRSDYQVLFADLDPQDAAAMVAELDKEKVDYKLDNGGTTILVDAHEVHRTRLKLMGKGMNLRGTVGFEVFNDNDFGTSEFAQKVNYQRALQGELARTIMAFDEVKAARVHLVMPEQGLFRKGNAQAKASVSVVTKGSTRLAPEQIIGIQRLIAASVPEIDPSSVTIIDQRGVALTASTAEDKSMPGANARMALKKDIEAYVARKIGVLLDQALGPAKAIVSVDVALNYDHVKITREDLTPAIENSSEARGVVVRKRHSESGPDIARAGAAGAHSNTTAPSQELSGTRSSTTDVEYQVGRQVEQIVSEPGAIRRVSVGVVLHGDVPSERIAQLKEIVQMAAGIDAERGDAVAIHSIDRLAADEHPVAAMPPASADNDVRDFNEPKAVTDQEKLMQGLIIALAVVLILSFLYWLAQRLRAGDDRKRRPLTPEERERMLRQLHDWVAADTPSTAPQEVR